MSLSFSAGRSAENDSFQRKVEVEDCGKQHASEQECMHACMRVHLSQSAPLLGSWI